MTKSAFWHRRLAVVRLLEADVSPQFLAVATGDRVDGVQALRVDVHEGHLAAVQVGREANILDDTQREDGATGADDADLDGTGHDGVPF